MYYTYDISDLTPEEQVKAKEISEDSFRVRQELFDRQNAAIEAGTDHTELDAEITDYIYNDPYLKYLEELERRHFAQLGGDLMAIYNDALERLPRLILRDVNNMITRLEADMEADDKLLKPEAIRGRIRYHLTMHLEALRADVVLYDKLTAEIERQTKHADKLAKDRGQIPGQLSLFDDPTERRPSPKKQAEAMGAVTTLNGYLPFISNKNYQYAFTSKANKYAYMVNADRDLMEEIIRESQGANDGQLNITDKTGVALANSMGVKPIDMPFLSAFFEAMRKSKASGSVSNYVAVYLPSFCRELGIKLKKLDPETADELGIDWKDEDGGASDGSDSQGAIVEDSKKNDNDFWARLKTVKNYIGIIKERYYVRFMSEIVAWDEELQIIYLDFPYLKFLADAIEQDPTTKVTTKKENNLIYEKKNYNFLMHSDITNVRNQAAVNIAVFIVDRILQHGQKPDAKQKQNQYVQYNREDQKNITFYISCSELVESIPDFKYRLENMQSNATDRGKIEKNILNQQNLALKSAFTRAYELIAEKSDAYDYFRNLEITTDVIPTMRTLKDKRICIKHRGKNPDWKPSAQDRKKQQRKADRIKKTIKKDRK